MEVKRSDLDIGGFSFPRTRPGSLFNIATVECVGSQGKPTKSKIARILMVTNLCPGLLIQRLVAEGLQANTGAMRVSRREGIHLFSENVTYTRRLLPLNTFALLRSSGQL